MHADSLSRHFSTLSGVFGPTDSMSDTDLLCDNNSFTKLYSLSRRLEQQRDNLRNGVPELRECIARLRYTIAFFRDKLKPFVDLFGDMKEVDMADPRNIRGHMNLLMESDTSIMKDKPSFDGASDLLESFFMELLMAKNECYEHQNNTIESYIIVSNSNYILGCVWIYLCLHTHVGKCGRNDDGDFEYDGLIMARVMPIIDMVHDRLKYSDALSREYLKKFANRTKRSLLGDSADKYKRAVAFCLSNNEKFLDSDW
jgi:hypothetical protein